MTEATTKTETAPASDYTVLLANIQHNLLQLDSAVSLLEPRFTTRALRALTPIRTKLGKGGEQLAEVIRDGGFYPTGSERQSALITALGNPSPPSKDAPSPPPAATTSSTSASMDIDAPAPSASTSTAEKKDDAAPPAGPTSAQRAMALAKKKQDETLKEIATRVPEADAYLAVLTVVSLLDQGKIDEGKVLSTSLIEYFTSLNRRTLDQLTSKLYFYWVRLHELSGDDTGELRGTLLSAIRTATLRHDVDLQATLLPLLLRNYLDHGLYEQADRLVSKTVFPEGTAQNAQLARWFYYVGRIRAIQLNYTAAHSSLLQAIRRAPSDMSIAPGFFQHAYKLAVVVELLMGEIPERKTFREEVLKKSLRGYLEVAQAVRIGDIQAFNAALTSHTLQFTHDRTLTLIHRLRHTVIKTALRTLSLAYSRISLADISSKLALDSEEDAEYVVAKAIRDGVVSAKVDHEKGEMRSRELGDVYATGEPSREFDRRIQFLLELHNQSVKSMRYPLNAHSKELASADEARERERELAKEIEEGDEDADLDGAGDMDSF